DADELKWFQSAWAMTGKKLDMGKCCIRFKKVEDLALNVIGESLRRMPAERYIEQYESGLHDRVSRKSSAKRAAPKKAEAGKSHRKKAGAKAPLKASRNSAVSNRKKAAQSSR